MREVVRGDKQNLNLQIATRKSVSFTAHIELICALKLQIFSGCVYHLEQLRIHAQSPFLFPVVFARISLIPFCDFGSVLAVLRSGMRYFTSTTAGRTCCCLWLWCFTAGCHVKSLRLFQLSLKGTCDPRWAGRKHKTVVFLQSNAVLEQACHTKLPLFAIGRRRWSCRRLRWAHLPPLLPKSMLCRSYYPQSLCVFITIHCHALNKMASFRWHSNRQCEVKGESK